MWRGGYNFKPLNNITKSFFQFCEAEAPLGTRDWISYSFLKEQGFHNIVMTGCPAFYDFDYLNNISVKKKEIRKICVSDNAYENNNELLLELLKYLRKNFSSAKIELIIHRQVKEFIESKINDGYFDNLGIDVKKISGSVEGFHSYDDCSLHIGFRVHAHIYNLSRRNVSILINEDMRGEGINSTLGLPSINCSDSKKSLLNRNVKFFGNVLNVNLNFGTTYSPILSKVESSLERIESGNLIEYEQAFFRMKYYWQNMKKYYEDLF